MVANQFKLRSHPADFEILYSAMKSTSLEMGITMERTSRSPIYFSARDFSTAIFDRGGSLITLSEFIPILIAASPFAIKAALKYFGDDIHHGDLILLNDPYTYDGGNHLADWTILLPVFHHGQLWFWTVTKAHQMDIGGAVMGAYNASATDCFAEGVRIPPIKLYDKGRLRRDVFDFVLANVRFPEAQRGDLWSMIGATRVGKERLLNILDVWGEEKIQKFLLDLMDYTEFLMRVEIDKVPDGIYYGEAYSDGPLDSDQLITIRCKTTVNGDSIIVDFNKSDPMVSRFYNSTVANTHCAVFIALMSSIGRPIKYRSEGCMRAVEIRTKLGTVVHAVYPAPHMMCTVFIAKQIVAAVWDSLAKAIPEKTPADWGGFANANLYGTDPRHNNEAYTEPFFLSASSGAGAMSDTDGWHGIGTPCHMGGIQYPQIEIQELTMPIFLKKWEFITDSAGAGRSRGGAGMESAFMLTEADEMHFTQTGNYYKAMPTAGIAGGRRPLTNSKQFITRADGIKEESSGGESYTLRRGDALTCLAQGGCGVGNPLDRDVEKVRQDVINELVSVEKARDIYGVVIDSNTSQLDEALTQELRVEKKKLQQIHYQ